MAAVLVSMSSNVRERTMKLAVGDHNGLAVLVQQVIKHLSMS
jgi:hypothetical protein